MLADTLRGASFTALRLLMPALLRGVSFLLALIGVQREPSRSRLLPTCRGASLTDFEFFTAAKFHPYLLTILSLFNKLSFICLFLAKDLGTLGPG